MASAQQISEKQFPPVAAPERSASRMRVRVCLTALLAILVLVAFDALVFRTPLYPSVLEPDSSTGLFELVLQRERAAQAQLGDNVVVTLGDSRFKYSPRLANSLTSQTGLVFRHAGVPGTNPRCWYYMLRDLDPTARRYQAIVFGVEDLDDVDYADDPSDELRSMHYVIARLRWTDAFDFARSFHSPRLQWEAFRDSVLEGMVYQADVRAFLTGPLKRIRYVREVRRNYEEKTYNFLEPTVSMAGLEIDWSAWKAKFPPGADANQHNTVNVLLRKPVRQAGLTAEYRRRWFGRILDRYHGSRTRIIFVRLPRGAVPPPGNLVEKKVSTIRDFTALPNVRVLDEDSFESLEHPELFQDGIHLNREGVARFSPMLAEKIGGMLGPSNAKAAGANAF